MSIPSATQFNAAFNGISGKEFRAESSKIGGGNGNKIGEKGNDILKITVTGKFGQQQELEFEVVRTKGKFALFDRIFGRNITIKPVGNRSATPAEQKVIDMFKHKRSGNFFTARTHLGRWKKFEAFLSKIGKNVDFSGRTDGNKISWQVGGYSKKPENPKHKDPLKGNEGSTSGNSAVNDSVDEGVTKAGVKTQGNTRGKNTYDPFGNKVTLDQEVGFRNMAEAATGWDQSNHD
ncbi:MAG: hypothetical protein LW808_001730 [Verrucomicrobiota bacterium]|nr:MAG: hypothetical protein LW808_001730 [Verrucomicrobiota bacterium]